MQIARQLLLAASENRWLREWAPRSPLVRRAALRFMPGEDVDAALAAASVLRREGVRAILTQLGENVRDTGGAAAVTSHYESVLEKIRTQGLDAHLSVKPTQLGFDIGFEVCRDHLEKLLDRARSTGNFIWIDMEGSRYTDSTLELFRQLRPTYDNLGICLQAYLYRTAEDVRSLLPLAPAIRLCKGAYREPANRAFPRKADVDRQYLALALLLLSDGAQGAGVHAAFATHDRQILRRIEALVAEKPVRYEFQMLYGIARDEQRRLARVGHTVRVLISYGDSWFPWYMRRLAERPANLLFAMRSVVGR